MGCVGLAKIADGELKLNWAYNTVRSRTYKAEDDYWWRILGDGENSLYTIRALNEFIQRVPSFSSNRRS